jgi:hypothetical protein
MGLMDTYSLHGYFGGGYINSWAKTIHSLWSTNHSSRFILIYSSCISDGCWMGWTVDIDTDHNILSIFRTHPTYWCLKPHLCWLIFYVFA